MRSRILRPPYCYRWAGLITVVVTIVVGVVVIVRSGSSTAEGAAAETPPVTLSPSVRISPELVRHTAAGDRIIALTFDDGPHPRYTGQIVDLLTKYRAKATFCMIGSQAIRFPDLVRRVIEAGMRLCNHTANHDEKLVDMPEPTMEREIVTGRDNLLAAAGTNVPVPYFRAPGGFWSAPLQSVAARNGMRPLSWSIDSHDWRQPGTAQIVTSIRWDIQPGAVILLHDGGGRREQTIQALTQLLPWFIEQGYQFDFPG